MKTKQKIGVKFVVLALLALPLMAWGLDSNKSNKSGKSKKADKTATVKTELTFGIYTLDDPSYRYGKYTGLTHDGARALADFRIERRPKWDSGDTMRMSLQGWRLGLNSRRIEFKWDDYGRQSLTANYREIPNYRIGDGLTPYMGAGTDTLTLPATWAVTPGTNDTSGFATLHESLVDLQIDTKRRRLDLSYDLKLSRAWSLAVDYRHETKEGVRTVGGVFGNWPDNPRSAILPAPVDYKTDNIEAMFNYATSRLQFGFGSYLSFFKNDTPTLSWQNAYGGQEGWASVVQYPDSYGQLALEPDNRYVQFKAYGSVNLNRSTRISLDVAYGRMEQDDTLLPYTINTSLTVRTPVPMVSADARIDTKMANLRITSQLARPLNVALNYHYDDRDNKTPQAAYLAVHGDSQDQPFSQAAQINLPFSYRKQSGDAIATYRFTHGIRIKGGVKYADYKRNYSEVTNSNEFTWLAGVRFSGLETASFKFDYRHSTRSVDAYIGNALLIESYSPGLIPADDWRNLPLLRKYYLTDRDRDEFRFRADIFPTPKLNVGLSASYFKDDYGDGFFGLNEAKIRSGTVDLGWYPVKNISLTAYYTKDKYDSWQSSLAFGSHVQAQDLSQVWYAHSRDDVDTYNVSLAFSKIGENWGWKGFRAGVEYTYSYTTSVIDVTAVTLPVAPVPALTSKLRSLGAWGSLDVGTRATIRVSVENSKLETADFAVDNVLPDTLANVLTLGESAPNYDIVLFTGSLTYRF